MGRWIIHKMMPEGVYRKKRLRMWPWMGCPLCRFDRKPDLRRRGGISENSAKG